MQPIRLLFSRALALALAGATASCSFDPAPLSGRDQPDGAVDILPDADVQRPDADPSVPDANPADANVTAPDGGMADAMVPPDAGPRCQDWPRPRHFDPCNIPAPSAELVLDQNGEYVYDTNAGTLRAPGGNTIDHARAILPGDPEVRLVSVEHLFISANARLRAVGSRPLLVASWSDIVVDGLVDVSSSRTSSGAGASTGFCNNVGAGAQENNGGGGGGGGGINGDGGDGGDGSNGASGGSKGTQIPVPMTVRGGCRGAKGGLGDRGDGAGTGGAGGGALQLTARNSVTINGRLHAGGAGGGGASGSSERRCGGGGGGSGGLIGLESPTISIGQNAIIAANGGGGGEGAEDNDGDDGSDGQLGVTAAAGGSGGDSLGGDGGAGGALANADAGNGATGGRSGSQRAGGGGGGGGAGYIILEGAANVDSRADLSPEPETR